MLKLLALIYALLCYGVFLFSFLYAIGFVGNFAVPFSVDTGRESGSVALSWAINLALLALFAVQHSGMARRGFKRWLTRWLPSTVERSTYVLFSSLALILLYALWQPLPTKVWNVEGGWAILLWALFVLGWLLVFTGTFMISHFDLLGLRQAWLHVRGRAYQPLPFQLRWYYRLIRHPLMLGFIIAFWATPSMSVGHLLFALATTAYILLALQLEERDLIAEHGESYRRYRREVPMLLPRLWRHRAAAPNKPAEPG